MTGRRGPDEFRASDERGVKESQIRTEIALERLINLQDVRQENGLLKTIWTFLVFLSVGTNHFKDTGIYRPPSASVSVVISAP